MYNLTYDRIDGRQQKPGDKKKPVVDAFNVVIILVLEFLCHGDDRLHSLRVCIDVCLNGLVLLRCSLDCSEVVAEVVLRDEPLVLAQPRLSHASLAVESRRQLLQLLLSATTAIIMSTMLSDISEPNRSSTPIFTKLQQKN